MDEDLKEEDESEPERDEIQHIAGIEQTEGEGLPGEGEEEVVSADGLFLEQVQEKMKADAGREAGEGLFSCFGFEEEGDETTGKEGAQGCVEREGPVVGLRKDDGPRTREDVGKDGPEVEEEPERRGGMSA